MVVVGDQQQARGVREWRVGRKPRRVGVTVRADDRQAAHAAVDAPRNGAHAWVGRQQPVFVQHKSLRHPLATPG
jgi:hypothetical protein